MWHDLLPARKGMDMKTLPVRFMIVTMLLAVTAPAMAVNLGYRANYAMTSGEYRIDTLEIARDFGGLLGGLSGAQRTFAEGDVAVTEKWACGRVGRELASGITLWGDLGKGNRKGIRTILMDIDGKPTEVPVTVFDKDDWMFAAGVSGERDITDTLRGRATLGVRNVWNIAMVQYEAAFLWKIGEEHMPWRLMAGYRGEIRNGEAGPRGFLLGLDIRL